MTFIRHLLATAFTLLTAAAGLAQDRSTIVTVNFPLQYFAERLVGDAADVLFPVPQDVDPSFWRPSIADISAIQSADLILLNGAGFATWIDRVSLPRSKVVNTTSHIEDKFIRTESITHSHGEGEEHSHEGTASYIWLDPMLAIAQAEEVASALTARGIAPADAVEPQLEALRSELQALDAANRAALDRLQGSAIIATHPRYQYLARAYGLSISSLEWEAGAMPTQTEIADLEALVAQTGAKMIFWESEPTEAAFEIARELGLQNIVFSPLAHQANGQTYTEAMESVLAAISKAQLQ